MKINTSWSIEKKAKQAGKEMLEKGVSDLGETKIALIFNTVKYDTKKLLEGAKEVLGTAPIIGCTSSGGVITQDGYITSEDGAAAAMCIGDSETAVGTAVVERKKQAKDAAMDAVKKAMNKVGTKECPASVLMLATPGYEEEYIEGIEEVLGKVPIFGGTAADDDLSGNWKVYNEEKVVTDGVAVALFYTNKKLINIFDGRYHETIHSGVITKVTGNRELDEINGIKALKQYAEWANLKQKDVKGEKLLQSSILNPLAVKTADGKYTLIRHPMNGNTDNTINLGNNIAPNTAVIQMEATKDELVVAPKHILRDLKEQGKFAGFVMFHCGGRKMAMEGRIDEMQRKLKEEAKDMPFIAPFTFGECGKNLCGGLMISMTAIGK